MTRGTQWVVITHDQQDRIETHETETNLSSALASVLQIAREGKIPRLEVLEFDDGLEWVYLDVMDDMNEVAIKFPAENMKLVRAFRKNPAARLALIAGWQTLQSLRLEAKDNRRRQAYEESRKAAAKQRVYRHGDQYFVRREGQKDYQAASLECAIQYALDLIDEENSP